MNKRYRLVVFDWEGTLNDALGQVLHCVGAEAKRLHLGDLNEELARQSAGLGLEQAIRKVFPHLNLWQCEQLLQAVQHSYMSRHSEVYLIPGAEEIVTRLHRAGVELAVASNKGQQGLLRALQNTGMDKYFKLTRSASQCPPKPDPQMLLEILELSGVSVNDALMVGDSPGDMEMAVAIGMDAVGVNFYCQDPDSLLVAGALKVFDDYLQFAEYMQLPE